MASLLPGLAEDWDALWVAGVQPQQRWDIGGSHPCLLAANAAGSLPQGRALVPGCGRGYDVASLASPTRRVVGLEISPAAAAAARAYLAATAPEKLPHCSIEDGDFFAYAAGPFDLVVDYTMLCATLPSRRGEWAAKMVSLVRPGGELYCIAFPLAPYPAGKPVDPSRGPPFQLSKQLYHDLLEVEFECIEEADVPPELSPPARSGMEAVLRWKRKAAGA